MSNIQNYLTQILSAVYGEDVRQAIHDAIAQCYDDVSSPDLNTEAFRTALYAAIDDGTLTALSVADGSITTDKLADGAVNTAKLANSAVSTEKIVDAAINTAKILDLAITTGKIADDAVTLEKLGSDVIETFEHFDRDLSTLQNAFTSVNNSLNQAISSAQNYANGMIFGQDGLLYLTHNGTIVSSGIAVASSGSGGLGFTSVEYDADTYYLHFYDDNGDDVIEPVYIPGGGGSGSGAAGSKLTFAMYSASAYSVLSTSGTAPISFRYSSVDTETQMETGAGNLSIYVGGILKENRTVAQGSNTIDVFDYLATGSNTVRLVMTDTYGATASRTVTITLEAFTLSWNLGETEKNTGDLVVYVTPVGSGTKVLHMLIDGSEYDTREVTTSGIRQSFTLPLSVGAHTISVYGTMTLSGVTLTSDTLTCVVAEVSDSSSATVIAAKLIETEFDQYTTINIPYRVINPSANPANISFLVNGSEYATDSVDQAEHVWSYRAIDSGTLVLGIRCGSATWTKTLTINALSAEISEITNDLVLKIDANTITDLDAFNYNGTTLTVSNHFDNHNGGLVTDGNGNKCIKVMKGDRLTINYNLFGSDARTNGRNMKFVYKIENASDFDAEAIKCKNGNVGLTIFANAANMSSEQSNLTIQTCEGYRTELELNIEPDSEDRLMMFWEKGVPTKAVIYASNDNFSQSSPVGITVGSDYCDVLLYLVRVYSRDLTKEEIKANYYADGENSSDIVNRYDRNQVYDSSGKLDPDLVARLNPNLHVITWHAAGISEASDQRITGTLTHKFISGGAAHSWTANNVVQKAQGTSSLGYVQAGCNEDFNFADGIDLEDGTHLATYSMTDNSIGVTYLNFKTNVASQEHINNILVAEWYNRYQPYTRAARAANAKVRDTVEGHPAVFFFHNTGNTAIQVGAMNVQPDETVFYSLGCLNNSKKNNEVFQYDDIVIEFRNNISAQCRLKSNDLSTEDWSGDVNFEFRYLNEDVYTQAQAVALWQDFLDWIVPLDADSATNANFGTAKVVNGQTFTADTAEYRKAVFANEAADHLIMDTVLYDQIFNLVFSCVDNNVKNVFIAYDSSSGKWHLCFAYDRDTAMGNDNEGGLTLKYGYMDTDAIGSRNVFNGADCVLRCMMRYCFDTELKAMYLDRESAGAWNLDAFADLCDQYQDYACESLWIEDAWRKDIDTFTVLGTSAYIPMLNGKKRLQRRQFLHYQRAFMSSYFVGAYATANSATIRGYTPATYAGVTPASQMTITPYCDLWVTVKAGSGTVQARTTAGTPVTINLGNASMNDTEIYVRNAEFIADLGDLACLYPGYTDLSPCTRLQRASIGSSVNGYQNTNLTELTVRNAKSLEYINVENCPNLVQELDLSNNVNVQECYTRGSGVTGVTFADYGRLVTAMLNAVTSVYANHLNMIETFTLEGYDNLSTLNIVASAALDALLLASRASNLTRVRLKDMVWSTTIAMYKTLMRLSRCAGIDDDGHNVSVAVITGSCYFDAVSITKYNALVAAIAGMTFTYGSLLSEHTVTFVNDDGTTLYTEQVEHNGTADDPVVEGYIVTPTKAPDTDYVYTYYKWDVSLANVAADLTVTATYTRAQRINTVQFVDYDGTVLETYQVSAHGSCAYSGADLERSGYLWVGWDQDTSDVVEDMTVTAQYVYPQLPAEQKDTSLYDYVYSDDPEDNMAYTFAEFYSIMKMGMAGDYFSIGDKCKLVPNWTLLTDVEIVFRLHSIGHYELADGNGMSNADWYMVGVLNLNRRMNATNTNVGGWDSCELRTWLNNTFYRALPAWWRNLIASSITLANAGNQSSVITRSTDYLRIPSRAEVGHDVNAVPYKNEVSTDASEVTFSLFTDNNSRIKKTFNGDGSAQNWWLRSAYAGAATQFCNVISYGNASNYNASNSNGVCVGFSV